MTCSSERTVIHRSSNIELCRILAILLVVLGHSLSWARGDISTIDNVFLPSVYLGGFTVIGVNTFVFISGWFGIKLKKKSLINLLFITVFYGILRVVWLWYLGRFSFQNIFFISDSNWFVVAYLGLLLLSPLLNLFVENKEERKKIGLIIMALFLFQTWFGWCPAITHFDNFQGGYSILHFCILYLIIRYIRLYAPPHWLFGKCRVIKWFSLYILCSVVFGLMNYMSVKFSFPLSGYLYKYNNPLVIFSAFCFLMAFLNINMNYSKYVNWIASSTLAVLLIHEQYPFHGFMKAHFLSIKMEYSGIQLFLLWCTSILAIFLACVILDQFRILLYKPIKKLL